MKATHSFTINGSRGYMYAGDMIRWANLTCHIECLCASALAQLQATKRKILIHALTLEEAQARNPGRA